MNQTRNRPYADRTDDELAVRVESLDHQIASGVPEPDFVKLDVEGLEFDVLEGMKVLLEHKHPRLYIEMHGADAESKLSNVTAVAALLWKAGYKLLHVESSTDLLHPDQLPGAIHGHLYCT